MFTKLTSQTMTRAQFLQSRDMIRARHAKGFADLSPSIEIFTVSHASWRDPMITPVPVYIEDCHEDALDQDCIPLDEIEGDIATAMWLQDQDNMDEYGDPREEWVVFQDAIPVGFRERNEDLELAREGSLVAAFQSGRLG